MGKHSLTISCNYLTSLTSIFTVSQIHSILQLWVFRNGHLPHWCVREEKKCTWKFQFFILKPLGLMKQRGSTNQNCLLIYWFLYSYVVWIHFIFVSEACVTVWDLFFWWLVCVIMIHRSVTKHVSVGISCYLHACPPTYLYNYLQACLLTYASACLPAY
jgi:hypothetical protein